MAEQPEGAPRRARADKQSTETRRAPQLIAVAQRAADKFVTPSMRGQRDDIAQDAYLEYRRYAAANKVDNPEALIQVIARRKAMRYRDQHEKRRQHVIAFDEQEAVDSAGLPAMAPLDQLRLMGPTDPLAALMADRQSDAIVYAVASLSPGYRQVAELAYLHSPPINAPAIAEALELAPGTVRNRLVHIRRALQLLLADKAEDEE